MRARLCDGLTLAAALLICVIFVCVAANGLIMSADVERVFTEDNAEHVIFLRDNVALNLLVLAACLAAVALLMRMRITRRVNVIALLGMLCCVGALGVWWVGAVQALPGADSLFILESAQELARGNAAALAGSRYFRIYPFQTGFLLYCTAFVRLFGEGAVLSMQYCNVLYVLLSYTALTCIARQLFSDARVELLATLLLCLCWQPAFTCTFVYGVLPGLALALWGVYGVIRYLKAHGLRWALLSAVLLALAVTIKKNYAIVAIACGIALLLDALRNKRIRSLAACIVVAGCVIAAPMNAQAYVEARAQTSFGPGMPQSAWLLMGVGESSMCSGWHNAKFANDFEQSGYDPATSGAQYCAQIQERVRLLCSRPRYLCAFFYHKLTSQWNEPSFQSIWSSAAGEHARPVLPAVEALYDGAAGRVMRQYFDYYTQLVYVGFAVAMILICNKKHRTDTRLILPLVALGAFLYHAAFEAKAQYALVYLPMMLPIAAYGLVESARCLRIRFSKDKAVEG